MIRRTFTGDFFYHVGRPDKTKDFSEDDSCAIEITPSVSGKPYSDDQNMNPVNTGNGHYAGEVNFIMKGDWDIAVVVKRGYYTISNNIDFNLGVK